VASLADLLTVVEPHLSPLVAEPAVERAKAVAQRLPPMQIVGFERPLEGSGVDVDVAASFRYGDPTHRRLAESGGTLVDGRLRRLLAAVADSRSPLHRAAEEFWVEVDSGRGRSVPSLFLHPAVAGSLADVVAHSAELLGLDVSPAATALVGRLAADPRGIDVYQLGLMLGRGAAALRLCIPLTPSLSAERLAGVLAAPAIADVAAHAVELAGPHPRSFVVSLDVGDRVSDRIGVEIGFGGLTGLIPPWAWREVLDRFVVAGLCRADERDALVAWIGVSRRADDEARWPGQLFGLHPIVAPYEVVLRRGISHLKLVESAGAAPFAKAYFGCRLSFAPVIAEP
jgi:hypothetical protein